MARRASRFRPLNLGITLDSTRAARRAYEYAHQGSFMLRLAQTISSLKDGWQVQTDINLDPQVARTALEALAPEMSQPARDASLRLEAGQLVAVPAELGYTINIDETLNQLQTNPRQVLASGALRVVPKPVLPAVTDVTPALDAARRLLDQPVSINVYDPLTDEKFSYPVPRDVLAGWLEVVPGDSDPPGRAGRGGCCSLSHHSGKPARARSLH